MPRTEAVELPNSDRLGRSGLGGRRGEEGGGGTSRRRRRGGIGLRHGLAGRGVGHGGRYCCLPVGGEGAGGVGNESEA